MQGASWYISELSDPDMGMEELPLLRKVETKSNMSYKGWTKIVEPSNHTTYAKA